MNTELRSQPRLAWPTIGNFLRSIWERQWIIVCVAFITIGAAGLGSIVPIWNLDASGNGSQIAGSQRIGGIDFVGLPVPDPSMQGQEVYNVRVWVRPDERWMIWDLYRGEAKIILSSGALAVFILMLMRAGSAMFDTDRELVERGIDRRQAVRGVYRLLICETCFISGLASVVILKYWGL